MNTFVPRTQTEIDMDNPKCFFDVSADGEALGRIVMELRADVVPKPQRTFEHFALESTATDTKAAAFIA